MNALYLAAFQTLAPYIALYLWFGTLVLNPNIAFRTCMHQV